MKMKAINWKKYTYGTCPNLVPLENTEVNNWDVLVSAAGENPADEEMSFCRLTKQWNGHPRGSLVLTGPTVEGHPFYIKS